MKHSQMYVHGEVVGRLQKQKLTRKIKNHVDMPFFCLEVDEGKVGKTGRMAALVTSADDETKNPQRYLSDAQPCAGTTAEDESDAIIRVVKTMDWELSLLLWLTSDSCGSMEKGRLLVQKQKTLRICELIATGEFR